MVKNQKDFWSGLMFTAFGLGILAVARGYPFGTTTRMGAGFFPTVLAATLAVLGVIIVARACVTKRKGEISGLALKPLLLVIVATVLYGVLVTDAGFIAATFICVLISARASRQGGWMSQSLLSAGTTLCCFLIFIQGLGLPLSAFGTLFK